VVSCCRRDFVRSFIEQQSGAGSATAAQSMLGLLTGVAAHAAAHPTVAAFGLVAGMLREADAPAANVSGEEHDADGAGVSSLWAFDGDDSTAPQPRPMSPEIHCSLPPGGSAAGYQDVQGSPAQPMELDPSFWQPQAIGAARHQAALQLLYGASSTAFTRLPFDASRLVQQRRPEAADSWNSHSAQASPEHEPAQQQQQQQRTTGVPLCLPQLRPLRPLRDWAALVHPSAAGVLSELLAMPGMDAALEALTSPGFVQQLLVRFHGCIG
jgi:hypothetical protein